MILHRQVVHHPFAIIDGRFVLDRAETALRVACSAPDGPRTLAALDAALRVGVGQGDLRTLAGALRINNIVRVEDSSTGPTQPLNRQVNPGSAG